jgi:hypothetical protein
MGCVAATGRVHVSAWLAPGRATDPANREADRAQVSSPRTQDRPVTLCGRSARRTVTGAVFVGSPASASPEWLALAKALNFQFESSYRQGEGQ